MRILVTGAGGFIGSHLVSRLKDEGHWVRGVDLRPSQYSEMDRADEFTIADLRFFDHCAHAVAGIDQIYHLAADMGGIGFISANHVQTASNNAYIDLNMLRAAAGADVQRLLYSSSACVYNQLHQMSADVVPLVEEDAWPALPERGYGLQKLYTEELCRYYCEEGQLDTRIVRFHNVYGPKGTYDGGREKAPAAACRKVAAAHDGEYVEVWGDGLQTRSFMYIDDCLEGLVRLMASDYTLPLNLGNDELVTINQLFEMAINLSGKSLRLHHLMDKPQGVRGRNSDNSKLLAVLGWEPRLRLKDGLPPTYAWIDEQVHHSEP